MAKLAITPGSLNVSLLVFIQDSSSTTGAGLTGLAYNSAGLTCYYVRPGGNATQLTLATQTVTGAHSDGGFVEISSTNMPGWYRLDISDAIIATGVRSAGLQLKGATNMVPINAEIDLNSEVNVTQWQGDAVDQTTVAGVPDVRVAVIGTDVVNASALATDAVQEIRNAITGGAYALSTDANGRVRIVDGTGAGELDTSNGHVTLADGSLTATKIAASAFTAAKFATDYTTLLETTIDGEIELYKLHLLFHTAIPLATDIADNSWGAKVAASGGIWSTFVESTDSLQAIRDRGDAAWTTVSAATIRSAVGLASANLDTQLADIPTVAELTAAAGAVTLANGAHGGAAATLTLESLSVSDGVSFGTVTFAGNWSVAGTTTLTGGVTATNASNDIRGIGSFTTAGKAELQQEATDALTAYDPPTNAEMEARTLVAANYATASALDTVDNFLDTEIAAILAAVDTEIGTLVTDVAQIKADLPTRPTKNTALANFPFVMRLTSDHVTGATGKTVTATRSLDGAAFASCANSVSEVANGVYKISLAAGDLNGDTVTLRFTATACDDTIIVIATQP